MNLKDFSEVEIGCKNCSSRDVSGLQVGFIGFSENGFDSDELIEAGSQTVYFNNLCCNECGSSIFEEPTSYFPYINKICDQYEADEQSFLLKESLKKIGYTGNDLFMIVNKGYMILSEGGLEEISPLSNRVLSENDFTAAPYYADDKLKQDKVYLIKEVSDDIMVQHSE
jgi:hypothetical protein